MPTRMPWTPACRGWGWSRLSPRTEPIWARKTLPAVGKVILLTGADESYTNEVEDWVVWKVPATSTERVRRMKRCPLTPVKGMPVTCQGEMPVAVFHWGLPLVSMKVLAGAHGKPGAGDDEHQSAP